jgi:hypothetical protein
MLEESNLNKMMTEESLSGMIFRSEPSLQETTVGHITPRDKLKLAKQILIALFVFGMFIVAAYIALPENKGAEAAFELFKVAGVSLITSIVTYYFTSSLKD